MKNYRPDPGTRRVGLMGGTFDPIHYGHLVVAEEVRAALELAEMVFIPSRQPPHKEEGTVSPSHHRLAMLELAIASNPHFSISRVELDRPGPSYTVETLRLLREEWGRKTALYFVIGWDSLAELVTWHDPAGILEQLTYLVAVHRPGYQVAPGKYLGEQAPGIEQRLLTVPAPQLDISATDLRLRVAEGRPIKYQTPEAVERYIAQHGLYRQNIQDTNYDTHAF